MKIAGTHVRQSSPNVDVVYNGQKYSVYPASFDVDKTKTRYVANKLKAGKLDIPEVPTFYETKIVYATLDNKLTSYQQ